MRYIKLYDSFKYNNIEGSLITLDDVIKCIKSNGVIYANIIKEYPGNDPDEPIKPVSIDDDGLITVEINGNEYYVDLDEVKKIEY